MQCRKTMSGSASLSRSPESAPRAVPSFVRGDSNVRAVFARRDADTLMVERYEQGSLRLRLPRNRERCEAVLVNTGGGIAGGDRTLVDFTLQPATSVVATSQAAEKIYGAESEPAVIGVRVRLEHDARLDWLPQETILYDGAKVVRTMNIEMAGTATLTLLETLVLGRVARGEHVSQGHWRDRWRIRRDSRLVFAEQVRLSDRIDNTMRATALGGGSRAIATLVHVDRTAEQKLAMVRDVLLNAVSMAAASAWNGLLVVRFAAPDPHAVRVDAMAVAGAITNAPMPRAWSC